MWSGMHIVITGINIQDQNSYSKHSFHHPLFAHAAELSVEKSQGMSLSDSHYVQAERANNKTLK